MFLTIRGVFQGSFRAMFGVAYVFVHVVSRQDGELGDVFPLPFVFFFFGVSLDYLDFSGGLFDL